MLIQDQSGKNPRQWSRTGVVIEVGSYDSYLVSLLGSRKVTRRNRQFLRKISPKTKSGADPVVSLHKPARMLPPISFHSTTPPGTRTIVPSDTHLTSVPLQADSPTNATSLNQSIPLDDPTDLSCGPSASPQVPDVVQPLPPLKLRRSGPTDQWMVAGQQSFPLVPPAPGSWCPGSYPSVGYPGPSCAHASWNYRGDTQLSHGQMLPPAVCAFSSSRSSCLPRFGQ